MNRNIKNIRSGSADLYDAVLVSLVLVLFFCFFTSISSAQSVTAIRGGTVLTITGPPIENGTVLIRDNKIAEVGKNIRIPRGAEIVEAQGKFVMPGIVDAMTYYGIYPFELNDSANPITPENRIVDAYYPFGQYIRGKKGIVKDKDILSGGVTTIYIAPGNKQVIGGQGAVVKTYGEVFDEIILKESAAIDMAIGDSPKNPRGSGKSPTTRMSVIGMLRKTLIKAHEYDQALKRYNAKSDEDKKKTEKPPQDIGMEALIPLLNKEIPARIEAGLEEDIRVAIRLAEEFDLDIILDNGLAAYKIIDLLAAKDIPVILGPTTHPFADGGFNVKPEYYSILNERNAAILVDAGVKIAIASFSKGYGRPFPGTGKWLLLEAAVATGFGLSDEDALRAVTINAAEILGVENRVGSLEPGKDADIIILNGPPLSIKTWIEKVFIDGKQVYTK